MGMTDERLHKFPSADELSRAAAQAIAGDLRRGMEQGDATIALSGGDTPRATYRHLADADLPWERIQVYWAGERYVPHDAEDSNYRMERETLLDPVPIPDYNIHPMPTDAPDPEDAAGAYEELLWDQFGAGLGFDVIVLGIGRDGHTASLFAGSPALEEKERWVVPAMALAEPRRRLTLTLPIISRARAVHFLVTGAGKHEALTRALEGGDCPAALVRPSGGTLAWWVDEAALRGSGGD